MSLFFCAGGGFQNEEKERTQGASYASGGSSQASANYCVKFYSKKNTNAGGHRWAKTKKQEGAPVLPRTWINL